MVALLHHQPATGRSRPGAEPGQEPAPLRLVRGGTDPVGRPVAGGASSDGGHADARRPRLELVPALEQPARPSVAVIAVVALVVLGLFGAVRAIQGSPNGAGIVRAEASVDAVQPLEGDQVIVAGPGDSLWSIARSMAPDRDPRPIVAALIDANGGESVQIGQQIVIPDGLIG